MAKLLWAGPKGADEAFDQATKAGPTSLEPELELHIARSDSDAEMMAPVC